MIVIAECQKLAKFFIEISMFNGNVDNSFKLISVSGKYLQGRRSWVGKIDDCPTTLLLAF